MELRFMLLDEQGGAASEPVPLASLGEAYIAPASAIATKDDGYAVVYSSGGSVYFVVLDADGAQRFSPKRISATAIGSRSALNFYPRNVLMQVGDHYLATFSEGHGPEIDAGYSGVRIAVVDADGRGTLHGLMTPVDGVSSGSSTFVAVDDRIGLAWGEGPIGSPVCRDGCISTSDMKFMLIEPDGLVPASEVVTHEAMPRGILALELVARGQDILSAGNIDYHGSTQPATGAIRCVPVD